jgi:CBS domain-containing protein
VQRGSNRLSVHKDEEMKHELEGLLRSGHPTRTEEWYDPEPAADDDPGVAGGPEGAQLNIELARHLTRKTFPAKRNTLERVLEGNHAPDPVIDAVSRLPDGDHKYRNVQEIVTALEAVRRRKPVAELVKDVMTAGVAAVRPQASLVEVATLMRDQDIGDVLVAEGDRVVGVVTDRDIAVRAVADGVDPHSVSAASVASGDPVTVTPRDTVGEAVTLMREHAVRRLPVIEDGRPVGIVSLGDLAEERDPNSALADISRAQPDR